MKGVDAQAGTLVAESLPVPQNHTELSASIPASLSPLVSCLPLHYQLSNKGKNTKKILRNYRKVFADITMDCQWIKSKIK